MRCISFDRLSWKRRIQTLCILLPAGVALSNCASSNSPDTSKFAVARSLLSDAQMDLVTAGAARVTLALSATAAGPSAVTSTQGSIVTAKTTVLRIEFDPSAPGSANARPLGLWLADVVFGNGKAEAAGANTPQCSATGTAAGDAAYLAEFRTATPTSVTCSCTAFVIGLKQQ